MSTIALRDYIWLPPLPAWVNQEGFAFALRTSLSSLLALYIAFCLQLESPVWAWLTVWIVAQPRPGMVLSKGVFRAIGTIGGAVIGVVLIALFAQAPPLFVLALALVIGACTVASNMLTNFRAYATVLAGYTAAIVAADAISSPNQVFFIATARGSAILVGVACGIVANSLFAPHRAVAETRNKLAGLLRAAAHRAAIPWQAPDDERLRVGRQLIEDTIAIDTLIEFAAAESGAFRLQANNARSLLAHVLGMISARRSLDAHLKRHGWPAHDALQIYHGIVLDLLAEMPAQLEAGRLEDQMRAVAEVRAQLAALRPEDDSEDAAEAISARLVIDRIDDLLEHLGHAMNNWSDIVHERWQRQPERVLNFHRDTRAAWINGLRAFVAVCLVGAFWIGSAWPHGPSALVFVGILLSLFSSVPRPDRVGWAFFSVGIPAALLGLLLKFLLLPAGSGFDYLVVASTLLLIPLGLFIAYPATSSSATAFSLVFLNLAGIANPMAYDLQDSINTALAILLGVLAGTLAYVMILPPNPQAARAYVTQRIRAGLGRLAAQTPIVAYGEWETRMYDRINRLRDPLNLSGTHNDAWFDAALSAVTLGNEILRLRHWLVEEPMPAPVRAEVEPIVEGLAQILTAPEAADRAVRRGRARVRQLDPGRGGPGRMTWARVAGALEEIEFYLEAHPPLLLRSALP